MTLWVHDSFLSKENNRWENVGVGENIKQIITDIQQFNCQPGESVKLWGTYKIYVGVEYC